MSERHQEGLAHLLYGINMGGGFVALTGEVGTGKTTLCRCLLQQLPDKVDIALILNPKLNAIELLSTICDELGIGYTERQQSLKSFVDKINEHLLDAFSKGRTTVLLIDEAQNLSLEVLEQIRLLTNLETSKAKLLQILLVGQPELKQLLNRPELRQLNQRITARHHLLPLSYDETKAYIRHRLTVCNGDPSLFKDSAIRKVYQLSAGIPRIINVLCDRAMLGAYATNVRKITTDIINHAARETLGLRRQNRFVVAILSIVLLSGVATGFYFLYRHTFLFRPAQLLASSKPQLTRQPPFIAKPEQQSVNRHLNSNDFSDWLENPGLSLNQAIKQALSLWHQEVPDETNLACDTLPGEFRCFPDKSNWKELLELDRPAILEFSLNSGDKRYALLVGTTKHQTILGFNGDVTFPLADLMKFWNGNYLIIWQPPLPDLLAITPSSQSDEVVWLRQQLSIISGAESNNDSSSIFDESLRAQVMDFQRAHQLTTDGIVGARTLIHLENQTQPERSPHLKNTN
ncbi:AAA family ATPase [Methylomonas sp. MgM2]